MSQIPQGDGWGLQEIQIWASGSEISTSDGCNGHHWGSDGGSSPKKYSTCVQNCDGSEENDIYTLSDFTLIDLSLRYDLSESISSTIGVNNILDFKDENAASEQFLTVINPGRNFFISFDYNIQKPYEK